MKKKYDYRRGVNYRGLLKKSMFLIVDEPYYGKKICDVWAKDPDFILDLYFRSRRNGDNVTHKGIKKFLRVRGLTKQAATYHKIFGKLESQKNIIKRIDAQKNSIDSSDDSR